MRRGECFGLLGPNGAGKTTTVEVLEGLQAPDRGEVEVLAMHWDADAAAIRARLGIQLQESELPERSTVQETVRLFRSFYPRGPTVEELLATVELEPKRDAQVRTLSGGQRQRLSVACALVGEPDILFLDEPIFGEFHRPHANRDAIGHGVGLAISRRIARLIGGELTVGGTLGEGAVFSLWLPVDTDATQGGPAGADLSTPVGG